MWPGRGCYPRIKNKKSYRKSIPVSSESLTDVIKSVGGWEKNLNKNNRHLLPSTTLQVWVTPVGREFANCSLLCCLEPCQTDVKSYCLTLVLSLALDPYTPLASVKNVKDSLVETQIEPNTTPQVHILMFCVGKWLLVWNIPVVCNCCNYSL